MNMIKGVVHAGRIETEHAIDLPEGTDVVIFVANEHRADPDALEVSPAAIADWLAWYDSLEPLKMSVAEETEAIEWLKRCEERGLAELTADQKDVVP